jgi:phosphoribosylglycinamide formyltransferase-1
MSRRSGIVILVSGRGSNMQAVLQAVREGEVPVSVRAVISNRADAEAITLATAAGVATEVVPHTNFTTREDFDRALAQAIDRYDPQLVVLAGFMRILTADFIRRYDGRLINIHPSLLPAFPGLDTHRRALESRAPRHGATVHFVTPEVDSGPIIAQAVVPILPDDTPATLAARVLDAEHRIYPLAIRWFVEGRLTVRDGSVLLDGARRAEQGIVSF